MDERLDFRTRHCIDVAFVLPYETEDVRAWSRLFPEQLRVVEDWKQLGSVPPGVTGWIDPTGMRWAGIARTFFPQRFEIRQGEDLLRFPVLVDGGAKVSRALDLFRTSWGGTEVAQNQPLVVLVDPQGVVRFKYLSQTTFDRPDGDYLLKVFAHHAPSPERTPKVGHAR